MLGITNHHLYLLDIIGYNISISLCKLIQDLFNLFASQYLISIWLMLCY